MSRQRRFFPRIEQLESRQMLASISGTLVHDLDGNAQNDRGDVGLGQWRVYADANGNSAFDSGESSVLTDADGNYRLDLPAGTHTLRVVLQNDWHQTLPAGGGGQTRDLAAGEDLADVDFGVKRNSRPFTQGNVLVTDGTFNGSDLLIEYTPTGEIVQSYSIPGGENFSRQIARDVVVDADGAAQIFNAPDNDIRLTRFDSSNQQFSDTQVPDWDLGSTRTFWGDVSAFDNYLFAVEHEANAGTADGVIRFDLETNQHERFSDGMGLPTDLTIGLDGLLYVLNARDSQQTTRLASFLPSTMQLVNELSFDEFLESIAVNQTGEIFATTSTGVKKFSSAGNLLNATQNASLADDIDISSDGRQLALSFGGSAFVMDTDFQSVESWTLPYADVYGFIAFVQTPIKDAPPLRLVIDGDAVSENGGQTTAVVTRTADSAGELVVTLEIDDDSELTGPQTITIPDLQLSSAPFTLTGVDDALLDGTQTVRVTAKAPGHRDGSDTVDVTDYEQLVVTLSDTEISENGGATTLTVTRTDTQGPLTVTLNNLDDSEATLPDSVVIPDGQATSQAVMVSGVDDNVLDGTQLVVIEASADAYVTGQATLEVTDYEPLVVEITDDAISEFGGATTLRVTRTDPTGELTVQLGNNDPGEAQVAPTLTLAAGVLTSDPVTVNAVDDDLLDGPQVVTLTASADGYINGDDQLTVTDYEALVVELIDSEISEQGGQTQLRVTRTDTTGQLVVRLSSDDTSEATVDATVTLADGQATSDLVDVDAQDDELLDGDQTVTLSAEADGYVSDSTTLTVTDFEPLSVSLSATTISENGGQTTLTVQRTDPTGQLVVQLGSDDETEATVAPTLTLQNGQLSASTSIDAVDDALLDGTQTVNVSASANGYESASAALEVTDHEALIVTLAADRISENNGSTTLVVQRTDPSGDLVVNLHSDDESAATLPATITIPDGQTQSAQVPVSAVDDALVDGDQTVQLTASATDYESASTSLVVEDHEAFTITPADAEISELNGATTFTVTRTDTRGPLTVQLSTDDPSEATVPTSVQFADGQSTSAPLGISAVDDDTLDSTQVVQLQAQATGYVDSAAPLSVTDHETLSLTLPRSEVMEIDYEMATLTRSNVDDQAEVMVNVTAVDADEVVIPATVTIPANENSVEFRVKAFYDGQIDGRQTVVITAMSAGFMDGTTQLDVIDNPRPWQNPRKPMNVDNDPQGNVTPRDVLIVLNTINREGSLILEPPETEPEFFIDVSGDNRLSPKDVLIIVNYLNDGDGEGEAVGQDFAPPSSDTADRSAPQADETVAAADDEQQGLGQIRTGQHDQALAAYLDELANRKLWQSPQRGLNREFGFFDSE